MQESKLKYKWQARPEIPGEIRNISPQVPQPVRELIKRRGLQKEFLDSRYSSLSNWRDLPGAEKAAGIIRNSIENGERIMVHGDFDADGITATATALRVLRHMGAHVLHHLPCRFEEGYGLGEEGIKRCVDEKIDLLVTVDCGIGAVEQVKELRDCGIRVVVTDHHVPGAVLPPADAVVNPELSSDESAPWRHLSGAGVIHTVLRGLFPDDLPAVMNPDLVAIGTICDMVELSGDNRILVKEGLSVMAGSPVPGIAALIRESGGADTRLSTFDIGFGIGPRINSAGRITHADTALELLLEEDPRMAAELAANLESSNNRRKELDSIVFREALEQLEGATGAVALAASDNWHPGVIGISASKISRKLNKPAILISWDGETGRGSARGLPGMEVHTLLSSAMEEGLLEKFGGHSMAAGLTVSRSRYGEFKDFMEERAAMLYSSSSLPVLYIDGRLEPRQCTMEVYDALGILEPFGQGNPEPVWMARGLFPGTYRTVGKEQRHLQVSFQAGAVTLRAIGFHMGHRTSELNRPLDVAFRLKPDSFRGGSAVQLVIEDMKPAAERRN